MNLRLSARFLDALSDLSNADQRRVRTMLQKISDGEGGRGLRAHPVGDFISFSANMDLRVLAVSEPDGLALVHVDHHDDAYKWGATHRAVLDADDLLLTVIPLQVGDVINEAMSRGDTPSFAISKFAALPEPIAKMLDACADESQLVEVISALSPEWQEIALSLSSDQIADSRPSDIIAVDDQLLQFALALPSERWHSWHGRSALGETRASSLGNGNLPNEPDGEKPPNSSLNSQERWVVDALIAISQAN